jgi:hypothetical protein
MSRSWLLTVPSSVDAFKRTVAFSYTRCPFGKQTQVFGKLRSRQFSDGIRPEKRRRIHEFLSFRAAVKTDAGEAVAAQPDG